MYVIDLLMQIEMQRLQAQIETAMNSSTIVADAREMGFQDRQIRKAIKRFAMLTNIFNSINCSSRIKGCPQANYTWIQIQECAAHSNKSDNLTLKRNLLIVITVKKNVTR